MPLKMFHCLDGYRFFAKFDPVDGSPGEKRVSTLWCFRGVYAKALLTRFVGFINLFDLIGVRNSLTGFAGISPLTI